MTIIAFLKNKTQNWILNFNLCVKLELGYIL
jgi:hypothetical protein